MKLSESEYKKSKFTMCLKNEQGQLILFNSYTGYDSLCKIDKDYADTFAELFNNYKINNLDKSFIHTLEDKGHIVSAMEDEQIKLKEIYMDTIHQKTLHLIILPTEKCNFKCKYCYESFVNGRMKEDVMDKIISFVDHKMKKLERLSVSWFGGEPLLEMGVIEKLSEAFIKICSKYKKIYSAEITTNGYLLNLNTFKRLYALKVLTYQITIDGMGSVHNIQRPLLDGSPTFDKIIGNLKDIKENVKSRFFSVIIRTNCSRNIMNSIRDYFTYIESAFGNDKRFQILLRPVMDWGGDRVAEMSEGMIEMNDLGTGYDTLSQFDLGIEVYKNFFNRGAQVCYAGKCNQYCFNSVGEIFKCTCDLDGLHDSKIGCIMSEKEINSYQYQLWLSEFRYKNNQCDSCFYSPICLMDWCPSKRIHKEKNNLCPIDFYSFNHLIRLFDKKGLIKQIV
ncbi:uncharacterized protein SAMN05661086_00932 [Anaeromicropila populeti]|uniref:Radical SAM core domain-containing protein n=1 Tax=Anaeromicropila populeti TaxID=37658 RepID=A0A1I6IN67_9FIRM|nr:uncharacterized protein SAMN05661086_00932 [Anaeromicropila populeti]